jgi:hypothetical protein
VVEPGLPVRRGGTTAHGRGETATSRFPGGGFKARMEAKKRETERLGKM